MPSERDAWDKLDILGKIFSGAVLAVIAILIKVGSDSIAVAHQRGELVRGLIGDLTTKEQRTRQDIALIALNRSVGDEDGKLVVEIAERLVTDSSGYSAGDRAATQALGSVAFKILEDRDSLRAQVIRRDVIQRFVATASNPATRAALLPTASIDTAASSPATDSVAQAATDLLSRVSSAAVVFMQVQDSVSPAVVNRVRELLIQNGFAVPAPQRIRNTGRSSVRYFYAEDDSVARRAQQVLATAFQEQGIAPASARLEQLNGFEGRARPGTLEVWLGR